MHQQQNYHVNGHTGTPPAETAPQVWLYISIILFLVILGGLFAGLTLGLLSLDLTALEILEQSGSPKERRYATLIKPIRKQGHWLLVTLLLANVIVNESLPILTDMVWRGGWPAVVISSTLIVIFGEIIPQAVCSRYGLAIGANLSWFVRLLMALLSPVAYPISRLLDMILGEAEGTTYKRAELKALVTLHEQSAEHFGPLSNDEVTIIKAVLDLRDKTVKCIMTPLSDVYMLAWDDLLNYQKIDEITSKGHSRIPVHFGSDRRHIIGMLLVKKLVSYNPLESRHVRDFVQHIHSVPVIDPTVACFDILNLFQEGRSHLAIIADNDPDTIRLASFAAIDASNSFKRPVLNVIGIICLEDVIEELIGEEIIDETDLSNDMHQQEIARRFRSNKGPNATPRLGPILSASNIISVPGSTLLPPFFVTQSSAPVLDKHQRSRGASSSGVSFDLMQGSHHTTTSGELNKQLGSLLVRDALKPLAGKDYSADETSRLLPGTAEQASPLLMPVSPSTDK